LAKLNPQGQIHAQELYAAINLVRRCPPGPILDILNSNAWSVFLGIYTLDSKIIQRSMIVSIWQK